MGFYSKEEPACPVAEKATAGTLPRAREPRPRNVIPPILTVGIGHRFHNPSLGRWLSRDPIGEEGGNHLYRAFNNDAVMGFDYMGLATRQCCVSGKWESYEDRTQCCADGLIKDLSTVCVRAAQGHAWIFTKNERTGKANTYGRWKKGHRSAGYIQDSGVYQDIERRGYERAKYSEKCCTVCNYQPTVDSGFGGCPTPSALRWIATKLGIIGPETDIGDRKNNCSTYAKDEWNRACGGNLSASFLGLVDTPDLLRRQIDRSNEMDRQWSRFWETDRLLQGIH